MHRFHFFLIHSIEGHWGYFQTVTTENTGVWLSLWEPDSNAFGVIPKSEIAVVSSFLWGPHPALLPTEYVGFISLHSYQHTLFAFFEASHSWQVWHPIMHFHGSYWYQTLLSYIEWAFVCLLGRNVDCSSLFIFNEVIWILSAVLF